MAIGDSYPQVNWERVATFGTSQRTDAIDLGGTLMAGIAVTTNNLAATSLTFELAKGSTHTFYPLMTSSGGTLAVTVSTQAAQIYLLTASKVNSALWVKVVANSTAGADTGKQLIIVTHPHA